MGEFKRIGNFIISLFLMFLFVLCSVSIFTRTRLLNDKFYINKLANSKYYTYLNEEIRAGFKSLSDISAIPEDIFNNSVSEDFIKKESEKNIENTMDYMLYKVSDGTTKVDFSKVDETLVNNIEAYAREKNIDISKNKDKYLKGLMTDTEQIINNHVNLFNINLIQKSSDFQKFRKVSYNLYSKVALFPLTIAVLIVLLWIINFKYSHRVLFWTGSSMVAASLFTLIPSTLGLLSKMSYRVAFKVPYLKEAIREFMLGDLYYLFYLSLCLLILGIIMLLAYRAIGKIKRRRH